MVLGECDRENNSEQKEVTRKAMIAVHQALRTIQHAIPKNTDGKTTDEHIIAKEARQAAEALRNWMRNGDKVDEYAWEIIARILGGMLDPWEEKNREERKHGSVKVRER